jgi:hypothetical protein
MGQEPWAIGPTALDFAVVMSCEADVQVFARSFIEPIMSD